MQTWDKYCPASISTVRGKNNQKKRFTHKSKSMYKEKHTLDGRLRKAPLGWKWLATKWFSKRLIHIRHGRVRVQRLWGHRSALPCEYSNPFVSLLDFLSSMSGYSVEGQNIQARWFLSVFRNVQVFGASSFDSLCIWNLYHRISFVRIYRFYLVFNFPQVWQISP